MVLKERHIQLLKHVKSYAGIKRFHGLLPKREAVLYEPELINELVEFGLIEEGSICTSCGNNLVGYRISRKADREFENNGIDFRDSDWDNLRDIDMEIDECLDKVHIRALIDIYYLSRVSLFGGIAPRQLLCENYAQDVLSVLMDIGFVYKISLKGPTIAYQNGFVLSDKASRMLYQVGYVK